MIYTLNYFKFQQNLVITQHSASFLSADADALFFLDVSPYFFVVSLCPFCDES